MKSAEDWALEIEFYFKNCGNVSAEQATLRIKEFVEKIQEDARDTTPRLVMPRLVVDNDNEPVVA